jgi:tetratricopeptide (TPR) repeat protein
MRVRLICTIWLIFISSFPAFVFGQDKASSKAAKSFEKAIQYYQQEDWQNCESELRKVIAEDSTYSAAFIMLGDVFLENHSDSAAVDMYRKALELKPDREDVVLGLLANTLYWNERYREAIPCLDSLIIYPGLNPELVSSYKKKLSESVFRQKMMDQPVDFKPVDLGPAVNSNSDEYINALAADGSGMYFTRKSKNETKYAKEFNEDFYFAEIRNDSLLDAVKMNYPPGKDNDAGALCISPDGRMMFFTCCYRADSYGSCDLYYSEKTGDNWSVAKNMGQAVNSREWDAEPSISPDGKTLYFTSSRNGGYGNSDLWKTERSDDGTWGKPVNLGNTINTAYAEMAPFIHFDNQALYFSSSGHMGMGGADLFKSTRSGDTWSKPLNLGYPVNTNADELVIIINPEGNMGYISCNDKSTGKGYDMFRFELPGDDKPNPVTYLKGKVYDRDTGDPLEARFVLIDIETDSVIIGSLSDKINGEFLVCLPGNRNYALNVSRDGYLFYSDHFPLSGINSSLDPVLKNIPLESVAVGNSMILRNIFFDTDQYVLKPESFPELNKLADFLTANPSLRIEIGGHTDDQGTDEYNAELSLNRAESVNNYLVNAGIAQERMSYKGYGESKPVKPNDTEAGRAENRRTEITIVK